MRVLIVHPETQYLAGAETMLGYFLKEIVGTDCKVAVAVVRGSRMADLLPEEATPVWLEPCTAFSTAAIWRQAMRLRQFKAEFRFELVHAWAARDWELALLSGWCCRCPSLGTLHDHPEASFISLKRRRLMRWCAKYGLKKIVCVSGAVKAACAEFGYPKSKLAVVRNGLPLVERAEASRAPGPIRLGFLGAFSERKGLRALFQMVDALPIDNMLSWELSLAGGATDPAGKRLIEELQNAYSARIWWPRIKWVGWVQSPESFLRTLDLLIVPSSQFDPFPTVLLEAGMSGAPVLASRVGGVAEIVVDGQTGWLFEPDKVQTTAQVLSRLMADLENLRQVGQAGRKRVIKEFSASKMVAEYRLIYSNLVTRV